MKYQYYTGGTKFEVNAPLNKVRDLEIGLEWQPLPEVEITTEYAKLNRTNVFVAPYRSFRADLIRTQFQFNF